MIVDVGGGTTDVAVISFNGKVFSDSIAIAGDEMDEAILKYILEKYNVLISELGRGRGEVEAGFRLPLRQDADHDHFRPGPIRRACPRPSPSMTRKSAKPWPNPSTPSSTWSARPSTRRPPSSRRISSIGASASPAAAPRSRAWTSASARRPTSPASGRRIPRPRWCGAPPCCWRTSRSCGASRSSTNPRRTRGPPRCQVEMEPRGVATPHPGAPLVGARHLGVPWPEPWPPLDSPGRWAVSAFPGSGFALGGLARRPPGFEAQPCRGARRKRPTVG